MAKSKESIALDSCNKVTLLGNKISVHMLEYLSTVKHHPDGFEQLTREFLDICRILFSIEAGLSDCAHSGRRFPPDMVVELERKFRATQTDFQELDRMVHKLLDYETMGTVGKIHKGFRRMFPDHDISRMRESLARSREALRMSALVFQWSLGDARIESSVGIGYTGLAAALDRMDGNRPALGHAATMPTETTVTKAAAPAAPAPPAPEPKAIEAAAPAAAAVDSSGLGIKDPGSIGVGLSRVRTADPPSPPPSHPPQQVKSLLDVGQTNGNGHSNGHGNGHSNGNGRGRLLDEATMAQLASLPALPASTQSFMAERSDASRELHLADELRLFPELQRRDSMSQSSTRIDASGNPIGTALTTGSSHHSTNGNGRSRMASNLGNGTLGNGSHSHHHGGSGSHHGSSHHGGGSSNHGSASFRTATNTTTATTMSGFSPSTASPGAAAALAATAALSDQLDAMSIGGSTAADSDTHAAGTAAPTVIRVIRLKADPSGMPRWSPRNMAGANAANLRVALLSAVQGGNYPLVEQLLDRGVSPDGSGALQEAVARRDLESMRLLLLFGGDANGSNADGVTPLLAAVDASFAEGATLLLKYGADPNREGMLPDSSGLDNEHHLGAEADGRPVSALEAAFAAGRVGLAQLLLAYGGDPNHVVRLEHSSSSNSDSDEDNMMQDGRRTRNKGRASTLLLGAIGRKKPRRLVDLLLAYGADPNGKDSRGTSPLFAAVQAGRADIVTALVDHGADINRPGPKHVLWPATYHPSVLPVLLSRGADMNKAPGLLELATSLNRLEAVRALIRGGADVNAKKDGVYTPLCTAIRDDHVAIFELLLASGADPNLVASEHPAWKCVTHHRVHMLPALVRAGTNLLSPPGIVEMATRIGNTDALVWLLENGNVSPDQPNQRGHTPLTTALRNNRADLVQLLLDHGANASVRGEEWPLILAVRHPALLERLLPAVADPRSVRGVLERAVAADQIESVRLLLAAGVSVEDKTGGVFSPLTTAIREGHRDLIIYLLEEAGADPNSPGEHLPLVKAIRHGHQEEDGGAENLRLLLAKGADINKTYRGWNAVMQVLEDGNATLLQLLTEHGGDVDLDVTDEEGRTVAQMAAARAWPEGSEILLAHAMKK